MGQGVRAQAHLPVYRAPELWLCIAGKSLNILAISPTPHPHEEVSFRYVTDFGTNRKDKNIVCGCRCNLRESPTRSLRVRLV